MHKSLALFSSVKCLAKLILQTYDLLQRLIGARVTVIGGFTSPVEKESLRVLLRGSQPVIVCPARSLKKLRIRTEWKNTVDAGRLLFLSPFPKNRHRGGTEMVLYRNRFVAALASSIFVPYAAPGGKAESLCKDVTAWGKPL